MAKPESMPVWIIFGILVPVTLFFAAVLWFGRTTESDEATARVRAFLTTLKMEHFDAAHRVLSEQARVGLNLDDFKRSVRAVPALTQYERFEPGEVEDPLRVAGTLHGAGGQSHSLEIRFAEDGAHIDALLIDDRALFGVVAETGEKVA